ncbi:hypothetical protein FHL15_002879 [Xylaria flabelliformis]|uniref:FAD-binding PCMH-type domain-containing protein n=1 Tax=Xylaria flabelliformis TaxID=2512241 RepID=A0A553I7H6_9PEZI|nr:hypothetical protein FHL15_002879 [Xylaria flabelliformis]
MESWHISAQAYLEEQKSTVKLISRKDPNFEALRVYYALTPSEEPALIARPQTVEDIQSLILYCSENKGISFIVCTGPRSSIGNCKYYDVMWIDMRDIDYVEVADDEATAKLGGGIAFRGLTNALLEKGFAIPEYVFRSRHGFVSGLLANVGISATLANAGYTGWTTISPFSARYGLGASQVVSVKAVNLDGRLVEANGELLDTIIQNGGDIGVIVEITIEVCSLKEMFSSSDESSDTDSYNTDAYEADTSDTDAP